VNRRLSAAQNWSGLDNEEKNSTSAENGTLVIQPTASLLDLATSTHYLLPSTFKISVFWTFHVNSAQELIRPP